MSGDIERNMPVFWHCRTWRSQISSIFSGVTQQKFTKFLHDIAASSPLLMHIFRQWYCNSFSNYSAKNASAISRRSWHYTEINWLPWQRPSTNRKTRYRSIICTQSAFTWWKDSKNWSSISWDTSLNMPVFRKKSIQMSPVFSGVTGPKFQIFTRYRGIICAVNVHIEVVISYFVLDWQSDNAGGR